MIDRIRSYRKHPDLVKKMVWWSELSQAMKYLYLFKNGYGTMVTAYRDSVGQEGSLCTVQVLICEDNPKDAARGGFGFSFANYEILNPSGRLIECYRADQVESIMEKVIGLSEIMQKA